MQEASRVGVGTRKAVEEQHSVSGLDRGRGLEDDNHEYRNKDTYEGTLLT